MLLIACPDCSRQYDTTGLDVGSQVRCFCECVFLVQWSPRLAAGALTCTNCGGAVSATDEECPYCTAAISEEDRRRTALCPQCFTRIDDESKHCNACGLTIRPQALSPLPVDRDCPRCQGKLRVRSLEIADVTECVDCLGMWASAKTFETITTQALRRPADAATLVQKSAPSVSTYEATVRYIPCLVCGQLMQRRQYTYGDRLSGTIIDVCRGHGIWLDLNEIEQIAEFLSKSASAPPARKPLDPKPFIVSERPPTSRRVGAFSGSNGGFWLAEVLADLAAGLFGDS